LKSRADSPLNAPQGYYRFPALHGDTVVFAAEGDLWRVGTEGGIAARLTSHPGEKFDPALSPDGTTLAFTASYEGPFEVYTMPLSGGLPARRTFEGTYARVAGWTPDGDLLYSTARYSTLPDAQLARLNLETGQKRLLPLSQASDGAYSDDGKTLFFTRLAKQSSHTKRYKGGTAQNLWRFQDGDEEAAPLTHDYTGTSRSPMCWRGRVYFTTDRDGHMNVWSMTEEGNGLKQHTFHDGWDALSPSLSEGRIAYQLGADLWLLDLESGETRKIEIGLTSDFDQMREVWVKKPLEYLTSVFLSPKGDKVALTARGQVFVAPIKQGRLVEVTRKPRVRYRQARFMPDGKSLLTLSDESGEVEFWKFPANGIGHAEELTTGGTMLRWDGVPSPDGKWIAHHGKNRQLWIFDVETKKEIKVAANTQGDFHDLRWSPDSKWLAYSAPAPNAFSRIYLYRLETGESAPITSDRYDSYSATWSRDGEWLYFLSDRNLQTLVPSPWGSRQPDPFLATPTQIFALSLKKDARFLFQPKDELLPEKPEGESSEEKTDSIKPVEIDLEGIEARLLRVPVPAGNYAELMTDGKRLYWLSTELSFDRKRSLQTLAIGPEKPEVKTIMGEVWGYQLSEDGKKLMVRKGDDLFVFDAGDKAPDKLDDAKVDLGRWSFSFNPREQLMQMFVEAWRLERDYFYAPNMHGVDWPAILEKYRPLAERVTSRSELSDLLGQMIGELSALHMFVQGGDLRRGEDRIEVGSLGATFERDEAAGGYRVVRLYRSDPDTPDEVSPLAKPGVRVKEGDIIEAINGVETLSVTDLGQLLRNQIGKQVLLRVNPGASGVSHEVIAAPISQEQEYNLRYTDWEYTRRLRVEEKGNGEIGYVHLRAMGGGNFAEWSRDFYPVFNRQGLIVDVRHNRGGNIDSWILSKLLRKAWFYWHHPVGETTWNMQYAFRGHLVVLINEHTASDGEAFAEGARRLELGKLIGTRTWGGEIWLTGSNVLVDRGVATAAEIGVFGPEGEWLIEGHGVEPDIVVDNPPHATFNGADAQLDAALEYLQKKIEEEPVPVPPPPEYPNKAIPLPTVMEESLPLHEDLSP
jgi:tricorn protease